MSKFVDFNLSIKYSKIRSLSQVAKLIRSDEKKLSWLLKNPDDFIRRNLLKLNGDLSSAGEVFSFLIGRFNKYPFLFYKQSTIAEELGMHPTTANKAISILYKYGLVNKIRRTNHPCLYGLPQHFRNNSVRISLSKYFKPFLCFTLAMLMSGSSVMCSEKQNQFLFECAIQTKEIKYNKKAYISNSKLMPQKRDNFSSNAKISRSQAREATPEVRPTPMDLHGIIARAAKSLKMKGRREGTRVKEATTKKGPQMKRQQSFDRLFQKDIPEDELVAIQKRLAYITDINKRATKYLGFSRAAQIVASIFPDKAIIHAALNTKKDIAGEERFNYFYKLAKVYCAEHGIDIDPNARKQREEEFGIRSTDPKVRLRVIVAPNTKTQKKAPTQKQKHVEDYKLKQGR